MEKKFELVENSKRDLPLQLTRMTDLEEATQQQCLALATIVQLQEQEVNTLKKLNDMIDLEPVVQLQLPLLLVQHSIDVGRME